jgi:hypothetical protein
MIKMLNSLDEVKEKIKEFNSLDEAFNYFATNRCIPNNVSKEFFDIYANGDTTNSALNAFKNLYNEVKNA